LTNPKNQVHNKISFGYYRCLWFHCDGSIYFRNL